MTYKEQSFLYDGIPIHYIEAGQGFPLLLLHGTGPGASTQGIWRAILEPLAEKYHVYAMDLIGFGRSGRKPAEPYFDVELWLRQCRAMVNRIEGRQIGVVGHSISGALSLKLAAAETRITKVLTTGTAGAAFAMTGALAQGWTFPRNREELKSTTGLLMYDQGLIDDAFLDVREKILFSDDYEMYFARMFSGDKQALLNQVTLTPDELWSVKAEVVLLHGRNDQPVPPAVSLALSEALPSADVHLIAHCGHSIALEHPDKLLSDIALLMR